MHRRNGVFAGRRSCLGAGLGHKISARPSCFWRQRTPIVALTASAMMEEQAECLANGMDDVMTKPFQFDALKAMIDRWCGLGP